MGRNRPPISDRIHGSCSRAAIVPALGKIAAAFLFICLTALASDQLRLGSDHAFGCNAKRGNRGGGDRRFNPYRIAHSARLLNARLDDRHRLRKSAQIVASVG